LDNQERKQLVLKLLREKSMVTVAQLSRMMMLSEVSIRKLLASMEKEGLLKRTWGGAVRYENALQEFSHAEKEREHKEEKQAIAKRCYELIRDKEAIFLDSGTTTMELARLIAAGDKRRIMVVTNALNVALELQGCEDIGVILIGGEFRHRIVCCTGDLAIEALNHFTFDRSFVSGNHFSLDRGFTTPVLSEARMKRQVIERSQNSYIVMDSSKYGANSLSLIAPVDRPTAIVTDWRLPEDIAQRFKSIGVQLIRATPT